MASSKKKRAAPNEGMRVANLEKDPMQLARRLPPWARGQIYDFVEALERGVRPEVVQAAVVAFNEASGNARCPAEDAARKAYLRAAMTKRMRSAVDEASIGAETSRNAKVPNYQYVPRQRTEASAVAVGRDGTPLLRRASELTDDQWRDLKSWARGRQQRTPSRQQSSYLEAMDFRSACKELGRSDPDAALAAYGYLKQERTVPSIAKELRVSKSTAERALGRGKLYLVRRIDAWSDEPGRCFEGLAQMVAHGELEAAGPELARYKARTNALSLAALLARSTAIGLFELNT